MKKFVPFLLSCSLVLNSCISMKTATNSEIYQGSTEKNTERFLYKTPFIKIKTLNKDTNQIKATLYSYPVNTVDKTISTKYSKENDWTESIVGDLFMYGLALGIIWWMGDDKGQKELTWKQNNDTALKFGGIAIGVDLLGGFLLSIPFSKDTFTPNYTKTEHTENSEIQKNTNFTISNNGKNFELKSDENGDFLLPTDAFINLPDALNFSDNFKSNKNNWDLKDDEIISIDVNKGRLKMKHTKKETSYRTFMNAYIDTNKDFSIEWESEKIIGENNLLNSFLLRNFKYIYAFGTSGNGVYTYSRYDISKKERNVIFEKASKIINIGNARNKFKLTLKDNQMYFYINGNLLEDRRFDDNIESIGFQVSGETEVNFYNLNFYYQNQKPMYLSIKDDNSKLTTTNLFLKDLIPNNSNYNLEYLSNYARNIQAMNVLNDKSNELLKGLLKGFEK